MEPVIRAAGQEDLPSVLRLWADAEVEPGHTDDLQSLGRLIQHDAGALLVAETSAQLVGSIVAAWDGWRGSIYRLAVTPDRRRGGLATALLRAAEERLATLGATRLQAIVVESDTRATGFWRATDWTEQTERLRFVRG
jgi:ribosomal protein S18 acetylase RimI-like enzyme